MIKYTKDHEWISIEGKIGTIGITTYAINELGETVFIEFPELDTTLNQSDELGTVESVKTVSSIYTPMSGKVISTNNQLLDHPEILNESPEENGWIIKIELNNLLEVECLMDLEEYKNYLKTI